MTLDTLVDPSASAENVSAIIQARTGSERLPAKVLADVGGSTVLEHVIARAFSADLVSQVIVAIPEGDDSLAVIAERMGALVIEGPEIDVLERFRIAVEASASQAIVRLTADCPLLDSALVDQCIEGAKRGGHDYYRIDGYPRGVGDAEYMTRRAVFTASIHATEAWDREHVGPWMVRVGKGLSVSIDEIKGTHRRGDLRVCVDEPADLTVVRSLVAIAGRVDLSVDEVIDLLDKNPELAAVNRDVAQRS